MKTLDDPNKTAVIALPKQSHAEATRIAIINMPLEYFKVMSKQLNEEKIPEDRKAYAKERAKARKQTFLGWLATRHKGLRTRCAGMPLITRDEFFEWAGVDPGLCALYSAWRLSGRAGTLLPVLDLIDPAKGWVLGNLRWMTFGDKRRKENRLLNKKQQAPEG